MNTVFRHNGHTYQIQTELLEVTSLSRPDLRWSFTDAAGHTHRWSPCDAPYDPSTSYTVPTTRIVQGEPYWCVDCAEDHQDSLRVCARCGEVITPGTTSDETRQFIPGMKRAFIDGVPVSKEEFEAAYQRLRDDFAGE